MAVVIPWPEGIIRPRDVDYFLRPFNRGAGRGLSQAEQILSPGISQWHITYDAGYEFEGDRLRQFETLVTRMRGRQNIAALPICDPYRHRAALSLVSEPWSDGTFFTDGTGFAGSGSPIPIALTADAEAGDTTITVTISGDPLEAPDFFSINGWLHRIVSVDGAEVEFEPPLRQAFEAGDHLLTDPPVIYVRFADDDQGRRPREMLKWGSPVTLSFVEAFDRPSGDPYVPPVPTGVWFDGGTWTDTQTWG